MDKTVSKLRNTWKQIMRATTNTGMKTALDLNSLRLSANVASFPCWFAKIVFISSSSKFIAYCGPRSANNAFSASSILPFFTSQNGDSHRNTKVTMKMTGGSAETKMKFWNDITKASINEATTDVFITTVFMVEMIPLCRIKDISLRYMAVVGNDMPIPTPITHLANKRIS